MSINYNFKKSIFLIVVFFSINSHAQDHVIEIHSNNRVASLLMTTPEYNNWIDNNQYSTNLSVSQALFQDIYQKFDDDYDFIILILNEDIKPANLPFGELIRVSNSIVGIGSTLGSNSSNYGSNGKLKAVIQLSRRDYLQLGPSLHELMHNWGNFGIETHAINNPGASINSFEFRPHWGFTGGNIKAQLGGFLQSSLVVNGGNSYTVNSFGQNANGGNSIPYSQLELYLMGMIPISSVDNFDVFKNITSLVDNGSNYIFQANTRTTYTPATLQALLGNRMPSSLDSQKDFKALIIALTDTPLTVNQWNILDDSSEKFSRTASDGLSTYNFWEATNGLGTINTLLPVCEPIEATLNSSVTSTVISSNFQDYTIEYGLSGFAQGSGTIVNNITNNMYEIQELVPCSNYDVYVKANCNSNSSAWQQYSFTTLSPSTAPLLVPFFENFNNTICQIGYTNTLGTIDSGPTSNNELKTISTGFGNNAITRGFNLTAGVPVQIRYKFKKASSGSLFLYTKIGTDSNPNNQTEINFTNVTTTTFAQRTINYLPTTSGVYYLSFNCTFTNGTGVIIDDFGVYDCAAVPINDIVTSNSVNINWIGTGTTYDIEYGLSGFTLGTGTLISGINATSYTITGLSSCLDYQYYIRTNCLSSSSLWKAYPFSTLNTEYPTTNVPYNVDFNATSICDLAWKKKLAYFTTFNNTLSIQSFSNSNSSEGISRGINLISGTNYTISYVYNNYVNSNTSNANLLVSIGVSEDISTHSIIKDYSPNGIVYTAQFQNESINFTPTQSGVYYIGFKTPANNFNNTYLTIDNFSISTTLGNDEFKHQNILVFPNPTSSTVNISATNETINLINIYDMFGRLLKSQKGNSVNEQINIQEFPNAMYLIEIKSEKGNKKVKIVKH